MIDKPGLYEIPAAEYHQDPVGPAPSLSSSLARILLSQSPQHCWFAHPRLNPAYEPEESSRFDVGTAAHGYLLEGEAGFLIVDSPDWRTKLAQVARADARLAGKVALLADQWAAVRAMAKAAGPQLDAHEDPPRPLAGGRPEQTLIWQEGEIWCRARLDWLHEDRRTIDDLKTTGASANPDAWTRGQLFGSGFDVQAAFYLRGLRAVFGVEAIFRFVVIENMPPFALSVIGLAPDALALAERKVTHAISLWRYCLENDRWPGYPLRTCWAEAPPWEEARWLERELRDERPRGVRDDGRPIEGLLVEGT